MFVFFKRFYVIVLIHWYFFIFCIMKQIFFQKIVKNECKKKTKWLSFLGWKGPNPDNLYLAVFGKCLYFYSFCHNLFRSVTLEISKGGLQMRPARTNVCLYCLCLGSHVLFLSKSYCRNGGMNSLVGTQSSAVLHGLQFQGHSSGFQMWSSMSCKFHLLCSTVSPKQP